MRSIAQEELLCIHHARTAALTLMLSPFFRRVAVPWLAGIVPEVMVRCDTIPTPTPGLRDRLIWVDLRISRYRSTGRWALRHGSGVAAAHKHPSRAEWMRDVAGAAPDAGARRLGGAAGAAVVSKAEPYNYRARASVQPLEQTQT